MVVADSAPEVPVMVTIEKPGVAVLLAVNVSTVPSVVVGLGPKEAVTPAGRPDAAKLTLPLNPYAGSTLMADVIEVP